MKQWLVPGIATALLAASASFTALLAKPHLAAVLGQLQGAGAARWQLQFLIASFPAALALAALVIAGSVAKPASGPLQVLAALAVAAPVLLLILVLSHAYPAP
ncbi:hypothetical protein GCM10027034_29130 [Ramlibacter solisilvae]|uniref:Uncharacterized protein n=1 Tax=Ramlibacter tataouinensis TaxID=94132 RepID=A0A127JRB9_9BURK|nr:hypothetical protein [Ramlibacter tataouinensis]AMO22516.1 hypothetical protein UC35_05970 [Ramlibacter tataouinensis]